MINVSIKLHIQTLTGQHSSPPRGLPWKAVGNAAPWDVPQAAADCLSARSTSTSHSSCLCCRISRIWQCLRSRIYWFKYWLRWILDWAAGHHSGGQRQVTGISWAWLSVCAIHIGSWIYYVSFLNIVCERWGTWKTAHTCFLHEMFLRCGSKVRCTYGFYFPEVCFSLSK